jgi:hypothetical protein
MTKRKQKGFTRVTVYGNGTAYFGRWLTEQGYTGELDVMVQPHCLIIRKPGADYDLFMESVNNAKRAYMVTLNDKTVVSQARGDVAGYTPVVALENVLRHVQDLAGHVSALADEIRRREARVAKEQESDTDRGRREQERAERREIDEKARRGDWGAV